MTAILVDEGRVNALTVYLDLVAANLRVGLFTDPPAPDVTTDLAGVTDATFAGYAAQTPAFGAPAIDGNGNALAAGATLTFTAGAVAGPETILGYYLYDDFFHALLFIELFPAPVVISATGQFVTVTPNWYRGQLDPPY
jgi:hypothetical protein